MDKTKRRVQARFGAAADAYVVSDVHARGESLEVLVGEVGPQAHWRALDIATGAGHCAVAFAPHVHAVVAADLTEEMLSAATRLAANRRVANLTVQRADAEALPFRAESFDLVTCRLAFHHFPHPERAVREFARVLHRGGVLGFTDNIVVADRPAAQFYNRFERLRDPSHHEVLPLARLIEWFEAEGLHVRFARRLSKEMEFRDWCDRQKVAAADRDGLLEMARRIPAALQPLLAPRWADSTFYFTLWEAVIVAEKA